MESRTSMTTLMETYGGISSEIIMDQIKEKGSDCPMSSDFRARLKVHMILQLLNNSPPCDLPPGEMIISDTISTLLVIRTCYRNGLIYSTMVEKYI